MADLMQMLSSQVLGSGTVDALSDRLGEDRDSTARALSGAVPVLLGGLARNASTSGEAASLASALDRDHDGSVLDDVAGFLRGADASQGEGILRHVLGDRRPAVEQSISRSSGMDIAKVGQLLAMVAPLVLGLLGRQKRSQGLDIGGLASMLGGARQEMEQRQPGTASMLGSLLDRDGDGSAADDVADIGGRLLGGLFKKR